MIVDFDVDFNNYEKKILNNYGLWKYNCPCCNAKNSLSRHAKYSRNICIVSCDTFKEYTLLILRLKCSSCNSTHAVLPAGTIPYSFYSITCIFKILSNYFIEGKSASIVANKLNISFQIIYIYITKFIELLKPCISFLRLFLFLSIEYSLEPSKAIDLIIKNFTPKTFLKEFFIHTKQIFFMPRCQNTLSQKLYIGIQFSPPT